MCDGITQLDNLLLVNKERTGDPAESGICYVHMQTLQLQPVVQFNELQALPLNYVLVE